MTEAGGGPPLTVREATEADAELLLRWRNDPATRQWSRSADEVAWDDHVDWLRRVLSSADRLLFVAERNGAPVGTVRFDRETATSWEVSITVAPECRGQGLSSRLLAAAEVALWQRRTGTAVIARVHEHNTPSTALFRAAGYVERCADGPFRVLRKTRENP